MEPETAVPEPHVSDGVVARQPLSVTYVPPRYHSLDSTIAVDQNMFGRDLQYARREASDFRTDIQQPPERPAKWRIWHLDSETEIDLDAVNTNRTEPAVELSVNPRKHANYVMVSRGVFVFTTELWATCSSDSS